MNEFPRQKLREIVVSYGLAICDDPQRCKSLLMDLCGDEYRAEIRVLMIAQEERVASMLLNSSSREPHALLFARLVKHMCEDCGFAEDVARWAIESWVMALGVFSNQQPNEQSVTNKQEDVQKIVVTVTNKPQPGSYTSIADALKYTSSPARIEVHPGIYYGPLTIDQNIEIVAIGSPGEVVIESEVPCLSISAQHILVQGITIQGRVNLGTPGSQERAAVEISTRYVEMTHCTITTDSNLCVRVRGKEAMPRLYSCSIHHSKGTGILFCDSALGQLEACSIYRNKHVGIQIIEKSAPVFFDCLIREGQRQGILIIDAESRLEKCRIEANQRAGIEIQNGPNFLLSNCHISGNKGAGIIADAQSRGNIEYCSIEGQSDVGVLILRGSHVHLRHCKIWNGNAAGVQAIQTGGGILEDCTVSENAGYEVDVRAAGHMTIIGGRIASIKEKPVIFFTEQSHGNIEGCSIEALEYIAIEVEKAAVLRLSSCTIHSKLYAITVTRSGRVTATQCILNTDNGQNPLFCDPESILRFNY